MTRVLGGTDGSVSGQGAVHWAVEFAARTGSELLIATAWQPSFAEVSPRVSDELREEAAQRLDREWCGAARDAGLTYEPVVLAGDPRSALLEAADQRDVDLVVVGPRGGGSHSRAMRVGSVTHHLIHHIERPLAAIPPSARFVQPVTILVGVDGSEGSARAVDWCGQVAGALHAEVVAVHANAFPEFEPRFDAPSRHQNAAEDCARWAEPLVEAGIPARTLLIEQEPVTALTEVGIRERAALIAVGTRGRGGFTGLRLGSTALKVVHHSDLPVLLVPSPGM
jgi:nucleotide-binding universal stress UspA family protein